MGEGRSTRESGDAVPYEKARQVQPAERDRQLEVNASTWPPSPPPGWQPARYGLTRRIAKEDSENSPVPEELEELILRFPSAPIHGLQRLHGHHMELRPSENFHTLRILRSAKSNVVRQPIKRIFLMHTGLNERGTMGLYYRLSSQLIAQEPGTVCIVRPFPGHMTRYPFGAFAETPLDLYLWDGSHLFRQFMRFMVETQWLLSALVRRSSYRCASGANLLGESDEIEKSRLNAVFLAKEIRKDWRRHHKASVRTAKSEAGGNEKEDDAVDGGGGRQERTPVNLEQAYQRQIVAAIKGLRNTLNLDRHFKKQNGDLSEADEQGKPTEPSLHALGYSLGGFTAQSVFMSWPFAIASCSTMLAGGALRELAPTGFADPEEWQTVLHSLRYELDDRMMSTHIDVEKEYVAGIDRELFTYLKRTFYEVFQQEYRGSIQTRYEAFGERMFFIVGGDDPVMRPETVLQSGPKGGLNLLEVGGLGHFLQDGSSGESGESQRTFWLPEMSTLIHSFSENAAKEHAVQRRVTWLDERLMRPKLSRTEWQAAIAPKKEKDKDRDDGTGQGKGKGKGKGQGKDGEEADDESIVRPLSAAELIEIEHEGALSGELFERCLDDLLYRVVKKEDGTLFILRNEVPTVFLPPQAIRETAAALYHDDLSIVRYCHGISARGEVLKKHIQKICLVLPWNAASIMMRMDAQRRFPSQAESAGGGVKERDRMPPDKLCEKALNQCFALAQRRDGRDSVRVFDGNRSQEKIRDAFELDSNHRLAKLVKQSWKFTRVNEKDTVVPSLPDCWIWVASKSLAPEGADLDMKSSIDGLLGFAADKGTAEQKMLGQIREDRVRVVNVSRARYNPRFRGRLVVDAKAACKRVMHAALCVGLSEAIAGKDREEIFS
jgi:hypothetical protein